MSVLALDTSNYTTSAAVFDGREGENVGRLLQVRPGELGLRQSDALFQHVKQLPQLMEQLASQGRLENIQAVGASTRPRAVEGSYMPCFLAGTSQAQCLTHTLGVPFFAFSHQQGHLAAAAWSAGRLDLLEGPFLAWHLSGGTTELLRAEPEQDGVAMDGGNPGRDQRYFRRAAHRPHRRAAGPPVPCGQGFGCTQCPGGEGKTVPGKGGELYLLPVGHGK